MRTRLTADVLHNASGLSPGAPVTPTDLPGDDADSLASSPRASTYSPAGEDKKKKKCSRCQAKTCEEHLKTWNLFFETDGEFYAVALEKFQCPIFLQLFDKLHLKRIEKGLTCTVESVGGPTEIKQTEKAFIRVFDNFVVLNKQQILDGLAEGLQEMDVSTLEAVRINSHAYYNHDAWTILNVRWKGCPI